MLYGIGQEHPSSTEVAAAHFGISEEELAQIHEKIRRKMQRRMAGATAELKMLRALVDDAVESTPPTS